MSQGDPGAASGCYGLRQVAMGLRVNASIPPAEGEASASPLGFHNSLF